MNNQPPSKQEVEAYLEADRNWGRWGESDQKGAANLITPTSIIEASSLVSSGRVVSLSRPVPKRAGPGVNSPAQHWMKRIDRGTAGGGATDHYGMTYHGVAFTHLDALCHAWDHNGMWNGHDPEQELTFDGVKWGSIEHWREGFVTRGVLLDVPRHRQEPFVSLERPVHSWELEQIASEEGLTLRPGDALAVYCGREKWDSVNPSYGSDRAGRPGLHTSCLSFIRKSDISLLVWDMIDSSPNEYGIPWTVHAALFAYGVALLDNARLDELAQACHDEGRYEFMLVVAPLVIEGGTGSPVNPLAIF
jgi:kynurenine formamidase